MRILKATALALILAFASFQISEAAPIQLTTDNKWLTWQEEEISIGDFFNVEYQLTGNANVYITDLFVVTDRYEIFLNGNSIGSSIYKPDWSELGGNDPYEHLEFDPEDAFESGKFSKLIFQGKSGDLITVKLTHIPPMWVGGSPFFDSGFAIKAIAQPNGGGEEVPEPATIGLLSAGFAGLFLLRRKK